MNKQFLEPTDFEIQYNAQFNNTNIVWFEDGQRRGFNIEHFEYTGTIRDKRFDVHPRYRHVGKCTSIVTKGDTTYIKSS